MNNTLVTVAIPIFNAEKYLKYSIQSVLNQTYRDFELILINDGSTDKSLDIILSFHDERIRVIDDGENKGLIERLNQSVKLARGEYYVRMDADDIMYITRIEEQLVFLQSHPDIDVLGASIMTIDDENHIHGSGYSSGNVSSFFHPTVMGRTKWFLENKYTAWAKRAEDTELWIRTSHSSKFYSLGKPLLFYREFGVPNTQKYIQTQITLTKIYSRYKEYNKTLGWSVNNNILTTSKIIIWMVFDLFGCQDFLVGKRRRKPLPYELCLGQKDLEASIMLNIK